MANNIKDIERIFLKVVFVKKKSIKGIISRKVMPVSFDSNEKKKLASPRHKAGIRLPERYFSRKNIEINAKSYIIPAHPVLV